MPKREQFSGQSPKHEQYEEWCALAAAGQLSPEEDRLLRAHLEDCESCRVEHDENARILRELPAVEIDDAEIDDIDINVKVDRDLVRQLERRGFRKSFIERATAEGHRFSPDARQGRVDAPRRLALLRPTYAWAAVLVVVAAASSLITYRVVQYTAIERRPDVPVIVSTHPQQTAPPDPQREALVQTIAELRNSNDASLQKVASLREDQAGLLDKVRDLEQQLASNQAARRELESAIARSRETSTQIATQLEQATATLTKTRSELDSDRADRAALDTNNATNLATQKAEVARLTDQLRLERASLDHDRELLTASRDITGLMGARALHIIDVHDADGNGTDRKSFGRLFYTEGKSLIFYAFDLDEKRLSNAKYTFEAWGERLGQPATAKSLGVLYADDKEQKRWALRVDDPRQLAEIDAVFVTLEPSEGSREKPRGRRILYAFLGGAANHP